jgi:hypothetical protein
MKQLSSAFVLCAGLVLNAESAHAGACGDQIAKLGSSLHQSEVSGGAGLTAPESLAAKLHHQPTPASIGEARKAAQSTTDDLLGQAKDLDAKGDEAACMRIVVHVRSLTASQ